MSHQMARGGICSQPDGHSGRCRSPESAERKRQAARARQRDGLVAATDARRLGRGERIYDYAHHHRGIAVLLAQRLGSRPAGYEVSRTCLSDCPLGWWGWRWKSGERRRYRLCIPDHYAWETRRENLARRETTSWLLTASIAAWSVLHG